MEIRVTESLGDITIREDDGSSEPGISQCRFVSYLTNGPLLEMNGIICSEFREVDDEYGGGGAVGIFTEDFVDQDDLYPYVPEERVRQDATVVTQVRAHTTTVKNSEGVEEERSIVHGASPSDVEDHDVAMTDPEAASDKRPTKPRRVKKPTYQVRKEEKEFLLQELDVLQAAQLKQLKQQAAADAAKAERERSSVQKELSREFLAGASHHHQLSLVNIQSALSGYVQHVPFEMWIYLGTDVEERRQTLAALKARKLRAAQLYIVERTRFLDPVSPFAEHSRFVAHNGDYCALRFDITPYEGISSVRKVYDALYHYFSHMEIWVTDILGDVTIREDDDSAGKGISQNRLVSSLTNGVDMEMNNVMYSEFREHDDEFGNGEAFGLFTTDFVDKDELFPYSPSERVRYDVTAVLTVKAHQHKKLNAAGKLEHEQVVVLTRSCLIKLRHEEIPLPFETAHELRESVGKWGDVMLQTVRQLVYR
ncbi:unnamed protein product [Phytophthora lilii]|uniref:Unnamed protein product n=1 Tax=Phytophthora lilii TaxID=2077276 RepID=A0A9W6XKZ2_9STRA|nr:unnamed protein product [Phytophthora lilii]